MHLKTKLTFFLLFLTFFAFAQETYIFLGSYNWNKNENGIYIFSLDTKTGKTNEVTKYKGVKNPSYLTVFKNYLYAVTDSKTPDSGSVSSFIFDPKKESRSIIKNKPTKSGKPV